MSTSYIYIISMEKKITLLDVGLPLKMMERETGLKPATFALARRRSINWATPANIKWWPETESNRRHGDFQSPALPTELSGQQIKKWRPGRGSNPRPLAWQASVLTNWTTRPKKYKKWWALQGSNLWPPACKADALPTELSAHSIHSFWSTLLL